MFPSEIFHGLFSFDKVFFFGFIWNMGRIDLDHLVVFSLFFSSSLSHAFCSFEAFSVVSSIFSCFFTVWTTLRAIVHYMFNILIWLTIITLVNRFQISCCKSILVIIHSWLTIISKNSFWIISNLRFVLHFKEVNFVF